MGLAHITVQAAETVAPRRERIAAGVSMSTRIAAAFGLLSVIVMLGGLSVHGYPDIGATGKAIELWANTTNPRQFTIGIYIESLGGVLSFLFAAWLWSVARDAEGGSGWLSTAGFAAAALHLVGGQVSNGTWWAVLDSGRRGADAQTLAGLRDIAQHTFDLTLGLTGVFLILVGYVLFSTRALPRVIGASAVVLGVGGLIPGAMEVYLLYFLWTVVVSLYLLIRPGAVAVVREPSTSGMP